MKRRMMSAATLLAAVLCAATLLANGPSGEKQLEQGKDLLEKNQLAKAAALFVEAATSPDAGIAARALYYLGYAQELQGKEDDARTTYARIHRDFPGNREVSTRAQERLVALEGPVPSTLPSVRMVAAGPQDYANAFVSADGRHLSMPDSQVGDATIMDLRTGRTRRLLGKVHWGSLPGYVETAMISPDGASAVYLWWSDNAEPPELRVVATETGARPTILVSNEEGSYFELVGWSNDGASVLITAYKGDDESQLAWVSIKNRTVTPLKSFAHRYGRGRPSLSPDGRYVAYALLASPKQRSTGGQWVSSTPHQHIYVLPTDGTGGEHRLASGPNVDESPVWTPDGKRVLFVSDRDGSFGLWSIPVENGRPAGPERYVDDHTSGRIRPIAMTADGTLYYATEGTSNARVTGTDLFIADVDGSSGRVRGIPKRVVNTRLDMNTSPAWSPDGRRMAFLRRQPALDVSNQVGVIRPQFELVVQSIADGTEDVYANSYLSGPPVWTPDGEAVLIRRDYNGGQLMRWEPGRGEALPIETLAHAMLPIGWQRAALAPNQRTLYLTVAGGGESIRDADPGAVPNRLRIVSFDLGTGTHTTIWQMPICRPVETTSNCLRLRLSVPALSPDGRTLAIVVQRRDWDSPRLAVIETAGGGYRELPAPVASEIPVWAPTGDAIFALRRTGERAEIIRVAADTGAVTATGIVVNANAGPFDVGPDGRIVYTDRTRETGDRLMKFENLLALVE